MTTPDLKELAKKAAEFLGKKKVTVTANSGYYWFLINENTLFENPSTAPTLMHLAQVEMEKRDFCMESISLKELDEINFDSVITKKGGYRHRFHFFKRAEILDMKYNENKFIAFWTALLSAIGETK